MQWMVRVQRGEGGITLKRMILMMNPIHQIRHTKLCEIFVESGLGQIVSGHKIDKLIFPKEVKNFVELMSNMCNNAPRPWHSRYERF